MKLTIVPTKTSLGTIYNTHIQDVELDSLKELMGVIEHIDLINRSNMDTW